MQDREHIAEALAKPLLQSHVKPAKQYGPKGDYLEGWFVIEEANRIFGWDGWSYQIVALDCVAQGPREIGQQKKPGFGVTYTCRVRLGVGSTAREDVGAGHGYDADCGLAHESAIKEAVTDALKRALRTFGNPFGLALYDKTRANVEDDTKAKNEPAPPSDFEIALETFIGHLTAAKSLSELGEVWASSARLTIAADPRAVRAKNEAKFRLTGQRETAAWP